MNIDCNGNEIVKYCGARSTMKSDLRELKEGEDNPAFVFEIALISKEQDLYYNFYIRRDNFFDAAEKGICLASFCASDYGSYRPNAPTLSKSEIREKIFSNMIDYVLEYSDLEDWEKEFISQEKRFVC